MQIVVTITLSILKKDWYSCIDRAKIQKQSSIIQMKMYRMIQLTFLALQRSYLGSHRGCNQRF